MRRTCSAPAWLVIAFEVGCVMSERPGGDPLDEPDHTECGPLPAATTRHLQDIVITERAAANSLGMNLGVRHGCKTWVGSSGDATLDQSISLVPTDRFRIYSITKTFTAVLTLGLVERGELSLDDSIARWYPDVPNASSIRIRHLLSHTSGLYDCLVDDRVVEGRHGAWDHDELIEIAASHGAQFPPGDDVAYVNTNYLMLGRIIEHVTGRAYATVLRAELLDPLGLDDTFLVGYDDIALPYVEGARHTLLGNFTDATNAWHDSLTWSAGGLVSTAQDQLSWFAALFGGEVLGAASLATLVTPPVLADGKASPLGHGVMVTNSVEGPYYSHDGGGSGVGVLGTTAFGFHAHLGFLRDKQLLLAVLANTGTSDVAGARDAAMRFMVWGY